MEYRDDYPTLVGPAWEEAMDKLGHNVTSHINESGPCNVCDKPQCEHLNGTVKEEGLEPMEFGGHVCVDCGKTLLN